MNNEERLKELIRQYEGLKYEKRKIKIDVQAEFAPMIAERVEKETEALERRFGMELVAALNSGLTRQDIEIPVLKSKGGRYNHFVTLGGGEIREKLSTEDRMEQMIEAEKQRVELNAQKREIRAEIREEHERKERLARFGLEPTDNPHEYRVIVTGDIATLVLLSEGGVHGDTARIVVEDDLTATAAINQNTLAFQKEVGVLYRQENGQ